MADDSTIAKLQHFRNNLADMAAACFRIRTKSGDFESLQLNYAQRKIHERLEAQRERLGYVRALILKGRQQGCSTYVAARFYHKTSLNRGVNTYILTHEQPASDTLFGMVERYNRNNPLAPHVGASNAKELEFDRLDSSYAVATAGSKAGGRSKSLFLFHGSEVAYWPNASEHFAAAVQGVPTAPGTEVILESTSAGASGEFYERCLDAQAGRSDYELIFCPWWWSAEYERDPEPGFELSSEEADGEMSEEEYAATFELSNRKMAWRRHKIYELRDPLLFRREYPATIEDAWTAPPGHEPYIPPIVVLRARKRRGVEGIGPLVIGVDPASGGGDRFAASGRRGLKHEWTKYRNKLNHEEAVAWCKWMIDEFKPARMNIDAGNIGANIVTSLKNLGPHYANIVRGVNFGGTSQHRNARPKIPGPWNRRAEMWQRCRDWLEMAEGASLVDEGTIAGALQSDLTAPKQKPRLDNFFMLESKEEMKKRSIRSPDLADSLVLTFAFEEYLQEYHQPVKTSSYGNVENHARPSGQGAKASLGPTSWMA